MDGSDPDPFAALRCHLFNIHRYRYQKGCLSKEIQIKAPEKNAIPWKKGRAVNHPPSLKSLDHKNTVVIYDNTVAGDGNKNCQE